MSEMLWIAPDGEECIIVHRNYPSPERFAAVLLKLIEHVKVRDGAPLYVEIEWRV